MNNILYNKYNLRNKKDIQLLCAEIFNAITKQLNLYNCYIEFEKLESNTYGETEQNTITINTRHITPKKLNKVINTIFHEVWHLYQAKYQYNTKQVDFCISPKLPIKYCNGFIYLVNEENSNLNPYFLYFTSQNEKDARDFANKNTLQILQSIKSYGKNVRFIEKQISQQQNITETENRQYFYRLGQLKIQEKNIPTSIHKLVDYIISITDKHFEILNNSYSTETQKENSRLIVNSFCGKITAPLLVYADKDITDKLISAALRYKSFDSLCTVLNSFYTKISNQQLNLFFDFCKQNKIQYFEIADKLSIWNKTHLKEMYIKHQTNEKIINQTNEKNKVYLIEENIEKSL